MALFKSRPKWQRILIWVLLIWAALTIVWVFLGQQTQRADASATACPIYIITVNPTTGGTYIADKCADGDIPGWAGVTSTSSAGATTSSAYYGACKSIYHTVNLKNRFGWTMFWIRLGKYWCWKNNKITYRPATSFSAGVTSFGSVMQWDDEGLVEKLTWDSPDKWMSHSWGIEKFKRCIPTPIGCIKLQEASPAVHAYAYGNGTHLWF